MIAHLLILAQEAAPAAPAGGEGAPAGGGLGMFVPMILIMVMFYFILIRPQRKQQKAQEEMRKSLGKGDKVVSIGGIHGLVTGMTDKTVSVKVADGISMKFDRSAIATVDPKGGKDNDVTDEKEVEEVEERES
ncbi:MAG: preprotein translocase subunit YajC [Verrucomicrobiales bacterium]|nr:preprotein translocase subunit YajC [Verrucomicrobiales bacterium]